MNKFSSTCHCGNIRCSFSLPVSAVLQCHCNNCRKMQGSDYSSWISVKDTQFSITHGIGLLSQYQINKRSEKAFCSQCGTIIYAINGKHFPNHKMLALGTVNEYSSELSPQIQVYTKNKATWVNLCSDIPLQKVI